jgi:hypothetical protein
MIFDSFLYNIHPFVCVGFGSDIINEVHRRRFLMQIFCGTRKFYFSSNVSINSGGLLN